MDVGPGFDMGNPEDNVLLNLFTDAAIIEHLLRNRFQPVPGVVETLQEWGVLNYFVRQGKSEEDAAILAWAFQVDQPYMDETLEALAARGFVTVGAPDGNTMKRTVSILPAGADGHGQVLAQTAEEIKPLMEEFSPEDLKITADTLREIRRIFDNLPDR